MKRIENKDDAEIFEALLTHSPETKKIIDHYIYRYGDRVMGELKLETETLREDPAFLIQILKTIFTTISSRSKSWRSKSKSFVVPPRRKSSITSAALVKAKHRS